MKTLVLYFSLLFPAVGFAQSRSIDWHKIAGGGGTSTNGRGAGGVEISNGWTLIDMDKEDL
jgi:hypothetical protein